MNESVCAIVVSYNCGRDILRCVDSINGQVHELVIIDNGSEKGTIEILKSLSHINWIKLIYNDINLGIASALNEGVKYALENKYKWLLLLDDDSQAAPEMVKKLVQASIEYSGDNPNIKLGIISPVVYDVNAGAYRSPWKHAGIQTVSVHTVITSGSLIKSSVFKDIGFFNSDLFVYYVDDDFCLRIRKGGYKILITNTTALLHSEGKKEAKRILGRVVYYYNYSSEAIYYIYRNGIYILQQHAFFDWYPAFLIVRRMIWDLLLVMFFSRNKRNDIKYAVRGVKHGFSKQFGRIH